MAEADLRKGLQTPVDIRDLSCDRDHPDLCDRANRILGIISTITNPVDISDRCARLLGQICVAGLPIDPRQIRNLVFATDKVDVSGSSVTTASGSVATMDDAFMELRMMADGLKDIPLAIDPNTSRVRTSIEASITIPVTVSSGTLTNLQQVGGNAANWFDIMDLVWNTGIRPQII